MASATEQSFANHRKFIPLYHFVTGPVLLLNLIWALYRLFRGLPEVPVFDRLLAVLVAAALIAVYLFARFFALKVQDRVIRLEEQLRLQNLVPADLKPRLSELSAGQLVALRFAHDDEVAELARRVLDQRITGRDEIKKLIQRWRADHHRA
ncbi:MAG TPA: DUF6526 family protein [Thermoanaerobaculia bacterium]|jgi:hypothetical protein|nr:DUF6526 family protein [Thermoanaerobaculia bacterium]